MLRVDTAQLRAAADRLIDMYGARAVQHVEAQVADACRAGDGTGSVAWSIIGMVVRQRLACTPAASRPGDPAAGDDDRSRSVS